MTTLDILKEVSDTYGMGWNDASMLEILCRYIDNQGDNGCFRDFVEEQARDEAAWSLSLPA